MKRTVVFIDKSRNKVTAECTITTRNGYPEFTMSGEYCGSLGQVFDDVDPANDEQQQLIDIWKEWHLNGILKELPEDFEIDLNDLLDDIESIEEDNSDRQVEECDIDLFQDFDSPECALALAIMLELSVNQIDDIDENGDCRWTVLGIDYIAGDDDEMNDMWDEALDNYLEDCVYPDLPDFARRYFDDEAWKRDARFDGRSHSLNMYDGSELEYSINGTYYYAYRQ